MERVFAALMFTALLFAARVNDSRADNRPYVFMTQTICAYRPYVIEIYARTLHQIKRLPPTEMAIYTRFTRRQADN